MQITYMLLSNYLAAIKQLCKQLYLKLKGTPSSDRSLFSSICRFINMTCAAPNSILLEPTDMVSFKT